MELFGIVGLKENSENTKGMVSKNKAQRSQLSERAYRSRYGGKEEEENTPNNMKEYWGEEVECPECGKEIQHRHLKCHLEYTHGIGIEEEEEEDRNTPQGQEEEIRWDVQKNMRRCPGKDCSKG